MKAKRRITLLIVLFLSIFLGCAQSGKIVFVPLGINDMTMVTSDKPISLINSQKINETEITYQDATGRRLKSPPAKLKIHLNDWNTQVIQLMTDWLQHNGIQVVDGAQRQIQVSVSDPVIDGTSGKTCTSLLVHLQSNDGFTGIVPGECCAVGGVERSIGYAINYTVVNIMDDEAFLEYLSQ